MTARPTTIRSAAGIGRLALLRGVLVAGVILIGSSGSPSGGAARALLPGDAEIAKAENDPRLDPMVARMLVRGEADPPLVRTDEGRAAEAGPLRSEIPLLVRGVVRGADLAALGIQIGTQAGPVTTVVAPLASVPALLNVAGVEGIDAPRRLEPLLEVSAAEVDAPIVWGGTPPNYTGFTGKGVLIGIVDTGLDLTHADFRTSTNQTRVKYVWDQTVVGSGSGTGYNYGTQYTESQINAGTASQTDANGHGTHMAGIAASNGRATSGAFPMYRYVGIAPEADLVVVKSDLLENQIIDGASYVFQKAASLGKDCVVLIASGNNYGAHDGTYSLDAALSALTGSGRIIVAAAGNQGGQAVHSQVNLASGQSATMNVSIPTYSPAASVIEFLDVEGWHASSAAFSARLTSPGGLTTGWISPGTSSPTLSTTDGTLVLANDLISDAKGAKQIRAHIWDAGDGNLPRSGIWRLELQRQASATSGLFDAWIAGWRFGSGNVSPVFTSNVDYTDLVMSPATADSVISVGAYSTKTQWTYYGGGTSFYSDRPQLEAIASFSSPGPRRDGVQRPDLVAPGQGVSSSLSAAASSGMSNIFKMDDGVHWIYRGTSAAAAHVAGAVAVLLQQTPHMTPSAARRALMLRARADSYTGSVPNATWGYGKLDLMTPAGDVGGNDVSVGLEMSSPYPNPTRSGAAFQFTVTPDDLKNGPSQVCLRILDLSGRQVALLRGEPGPGEKRLVWNGLTSAGRPAPAGVYLGRLEIGARYAVRKFVRLL